MGRFIIKLKDKYLVWSTIVDAPVTRGMDEAELRAWNAKEYGVQAKGMGLDKSIEDCDKEGNNTGQNVDGILSCNQAGPKGECLTMNEVYERFCVNKKESRNGY